LLHRTWAIDGRAGDRRAAAGRCHLFLLTCGQATLARAGEPALAFTAPGMLWLPQPARGMLQVMAGAEGYRAAIGPDFLQRAVGDPALTVPVRPLLHQTILAGPEQVEGQLATLSGSFAALVDEAAGLHPASVALAGLHLAILLLQLWRCAGQPEARGARGAGTVQRFRLLIELHYREGLGVDDFAQRLGVTRAHLHDACRRATGRTPLALLHERLLAEARARLEQTDLSVEQIGYGIGFRDPGYFNRFFKRLAGESPGAYRRGKLAARIPDAASFAAWP